MVYVLLAIVVLAVLAGIGVYNRLVSLRQRTRQSFADIDVQLNQRRDLVGNLVETVRGYATHERETLDSVVQARNAAGQARDPAAAAAAEGQLTGALGRMMALAEAYPDLKANANFQELQVQLADIENRIAAARRFYNNSVSEYNAAREAIPANFFAASMGFAPAEFFDIGVEARSAPAPQVKF